MSVTAFPLERRMSTREQLVLSARARRARLWTPPNGRSSDELEVIPQYAFYQRLKYLRLWKTPVLTPVVEPLNDADREALSPYISSIKRDVLYVCSVNISEIPPIPIKHIIQWVAYYFDRSVFDLLSERRTVVIVLPRQIAFYLARKMTRASLPKIGRALGNKDHTTVLHGAQKIERLVAIDPELARKVALIEGMILQAHFQGNVPSDQPTTG